jgi:FkbM family methyltransferase
MYCDSSSYPSVMAASGFVYTRMDRILKIILKPQMVFLDVGANVGFVSLLACSTLRASEGKVYAHCFEPDPNVFEWLSINRQLNSNLEMVVNPIAVGAQEGHGELTVSARSGWSTMVEEPPGGFSFLPKAGKVKVPITTLDTYCRDHALSPGVIKIDVEGLEKEVLIGARETLQQCRPYILIELNPLRLIAAGTSGEEIITDLAELGYVLFHIDLSTAKLAQSKKRKSWRELAEVLSEDLVEGADFDALAVPKESVA